MIDESNKYEGQGLRGPLWTVAGTAIANIALGALGGGRVGCAGATDAIIAQKDATIAKLEAEKYSDNTAAEQANRLMQNFLKPYGDAIVGAQTREAALRAEFDGFKKESELRMQLMSKDIQLAQQECKCATTANANAILAIQNVLTQLTKVVIPNGSVCPGWGAVTVTTTPSTASA